MTRSRALLVSCLVLASLAPSARAQVPELPVAARAEFLRTARVIRSQGLSTGVTSPYRLTLTDGVMTHDASFQSVDERADKADFGARGVEFNFADSHHFNLAAYQIAGMLGLEGMMPVTVHRTWNGREGTLTWWVDGAIDERTRLREQREPPNIALWRQQQFRMRVFAALVGDTDRNLGNILIDTRNWTLWMIDFTRAFRRHPGLKSTGGLTQIDRALLARLRSLDGARVRQETAHCLNSYEVDALMTRRDALVTHFDRLIADKGAAAVLYGLEPKP